MKIYSRAEWGSRYGPAGYHNSARRKGIMLHHEAGANEDNDLGTPTDDFDLMRSIQWFHAVKRGWGDIGYHFVITREGRIMEARGIDRTGAHCPNYNRDWYGVCFQGNYQGHEPTPVMWTALADLTDHLIDIGRIPSNPPFLGHRDGKATSCPGDTAYHIYKVVWEPSWRNFMSEKQKPCSTWPKAPENPPQQNPGASHGNPEGTGTFKNSHPVLKKGASGNNVEHLQQFLGVRVDGVFGPKTEAALISRQKLLRVGVDGIAGPETWSVLHPPVRHGDNSVTVVEVQQEVGVKMDGKFGPRTESAVRGFQRHHGLTVDGVVGPKTFRAMF